MSSPAPQPPDPPGLRERKKAETRRRIQQTALELFLAQGYDATTVEEIAAAAGVSHMTFYRHFRTKEAVVKSGRLRPAHRRAHPRPPTRAATTCSPSPG